MTHQESHPLDILIVGAGPIGLACALEAKRQHLTYVVLDKGCLVNSLYHYPKNMTFFSTSELLEIGGIPFVSIQPKPSRPEALEYYRRVASSEQLHVRLFEAVSSIVSRGAYYEVHSSKGRYLARNIIVATGFYDKAIELGIPGEDLPKVRHYYDEPHFYAMQDVIVVGANNSAVDAALETWRKGARVRMVIRGEGIGPRVKYWKKPDIENRIKEGSVTAHFRSELLAIRETEADIRTPDGVITVPNDYVIAMTGYQPDFDFLKQLGVALSPDTRRKPEYHPETMETNVPGVYLAGVVCGGMETHIWFIENSREHAAKIIRSITARNTKQPTMD